MHIAGFDTDSGAQRKMDVDTEMSKGGGALRKMKHAEHEREDETSGEKVTNGRQMNKATGLIVTSLSLLLLLLLLVLCKHFFFGGVYVCMEWPHPSSR